MDGAYARYVMPDYEPEPAVMAGSAAAAYEPDYGVGYRPDPRPEPPRRRRKTRYERRKNGTRSMSFLTFLLLAVVAGGAIFYLVLCAKLEESNREYAELRDELYAARNENSIGAHENVARISSDELRRRAAAMGLHEPKDYQIIYIDVKEGSYTTQFEAKEPEVVQAAWR